MKYKDYMDWLKENDPILYYELNSNPTGVNSDSDPIGCFLVLAVLGIVGLIIFGVIKNNFFN